MKLSEIQNLTQNPPITISPESRPFDCPYIPEHSIDPGNFYQELEMDSPYADIHRNISHSNTNVQFHSHAFHELICCLNSCGAEYLVGADRYKLQKGDIIYVPPGISHRPLLPDQMEEPYLRDVLWVSDEFMNSLVKALMEALPEEYGKPALYRTANTRWEYICGFFQNGTRETVDRKPGWEMLVIANTLMILTHLCRASRDLYAKPLQAEKPELLDQVLAYVERHLAEKITLADIARHFFISESTVTQTFRKKMGVSFYRCVTQRRLISAKALIERGLPLETVAEQVGFSDYSSFFRAFKHEYGISPRQYRKLHITMENK